MYVAALRRTTLSPASGPERNLQASYFDAVDSSAISKTPSAAI